MPIQRVFAKEGFGTVVTGVPLSGQVAIGDTLEVLPPGFRGRVKGLHAYKQVIDHGQAGHSTAVNLIGPEIDKRQVERGMIAVTSGIFEPTHLIAAQFSLLASTPWPLKHRAAVRFHAGTAEIQAKLLLLEGETIKPGTSAFVQILLEDKTVAVPGDRFILRLQSPMITLGGGRMLDSAAVKRKRNAPETASDLAARLEVVDDPQAFLRHLIVGTNEPKNVRQLCAETGLLLKSVVKYATKIVQKSEAVALKPDSDFLSATAFKETSNRVVQHVTDYVKEHPALAGIERPELKQRLEKNANAETVAFFDDILNLMKQAGLVQLDSNIVALPGRDRKLEGELAKQADAVEAAFMSGGLTPPNRADVEAQLKIPPKTMREIFKYLKETGKLVDATAEATFHRMHVDDAKRKLKELFAQGPERTTSEIRQYLGMNRKFAVPLVELLDKEKFTIRAGDTRRLV